MSLSLGKALAQLGTGFGRAPEHQQDGQVQRGARSLGGADTSTDLSGDNLGPEWASLLRAWVDRHKYYPPEAAENGEDGTSTVRVIVRRDGEVQSVMLTSRSGSVFLDMATQGLFRQQRLPPFPASWNEPTATIYFTMHYILIR